MIARQPRGSEPGNDHRLRPTLAGIRPGMIGISKRGCEEILTINSFSKPITCLDCPFNLVFPRLAQHNMGAIAGKTDMVS